MEETRTLPADPAGIEEAARLIRAGRLVAFPTETVYGLGADATDGRAVAAIFEAKGRPRFNPLIVHVPDIEAARKIAVFDEAAERLARAFWPGPLTLVLPLRPEARISELVTAGLETVAVRVPAHPVAQALLRAVGRPVAAPSANPSGRVSPTTAEHVLEGLKGRIAAVLDAGPCEVGLESTIVALTPRPMLLRPGGVPAEEIEACLGTSLGAPAPAPERPNAPGQLASHYAPRARLRLDAREARPGEVLLGFGPVERSALNLSPSGDLREAAANLFAFLRQLDAQGAEAIAVSPIPEEGLGRAINDRLRRAAAPRG
ncbi:L-threonylcarbamoyladenylate synthase [Meinhardsimonia xiamenensis]|jgi:L-threonylcarbamoyladenylate synthase|uniref:Threonylcarbamoyl-AMP synthase n=1 Tax=Meinhardsimonia xiamenensis TaxID=990712 RepID=A0A1G8YG37_9RHOB|nr:L-threonylcarbamoyladenylate synthase [Meinhardsimonia xiamenensis]PRX37290.1 translation factor SUA5 [Meinhardsimonia xiamenensis]SDK01726.1 L-threonylcarbamoyladenylate synthase [Meinhardsimonia xiamenensis]